jgi:hypothetical protein
MAFHEQHERPCPHCGERMSATAPKCLNCGRLVAELPDDEESGIHPRQVWMLVAVVVAITVVMVVVIALT